MQVIKEAVPRLVCTVCGNEISPFQSRKFSVYRFLCEGKKYPVYEYTCPFCSAKMYVSEKFLNNLSETNSEKS